MFDISRESLCRAYVQQDLLKSSLAVLVMILSLAMISGCAHISIQPKDPQLLNIEQFAKDVTVHLMSADPKTYEQFQHLLSLEITPGVLKQLKQRGSCAKSPVDVKAKLQAMNKANQVSLVKIESSDFPGKATEAGLVPVEVKGLIVTIEANGREKPPAKFDVLYLVGTNKGTHKPIVASIQIR